MTSPYVNGYPENLTSGQPITFTVPEDFAGIRLDIALAKIIPEFSRSRLTNWLKTGHILVDNKLLKAKDKIYGGETILINPPKDEFENSFSPENISLDIVYEDDQILVINKPSGLIVHPGNGNLHGTLLNGLLHHFPHLEQIPRAGIVHRLDKDTTGLMVVAKTLIAQNSLIKQLQKHEVNRIYRLIVTGHPPREGIIRKNISRDPNNRIKMAVTPFGGKEAITRYRVLEYFDDFSYVECKLETGRTHQIRVHLSNLGFPLVGDATYGSKKINYHPEIVAAIKALNRQALHALKLELMHPTTKKIMKFKSKLPNDMKNLLDALATYNQENKDEDYQAEDDYEWEVIYVDE